MPQRCIRITQLPTHQISPLSLFLVSLQHPLKEAQELRDSVLPKVCRLFQRFLLLVFIVLRDRDRVMRVVCFVVQVQRCECV